MLALPCWYTAPGTARPDHCPHLAGMALARPCGPDGQAGTVWPGPYDPATASDWRSVGPGLWLLARDSSPQACRRLELPARVRTWTPIMGVRPEHSYLVPRLVEPVAADRPELGYRSALDRIWLGQGAWSADDLADLQTELLRILAISVQRPDEIADAAVDLVVRAIERTHHLVAAEIAALGWLSERTIIDYLYAMAGQLYEAEL